MTTSPSRTSRLQEKEELKGLNSRLINYIGHVKNLKEENHKLMAEVTTSKEFSGKELDSIKGMYESELADARRLLDETAKEKARQQLAATKSEAELEDIKNKLAEEEARRAQAESDLEVAERTVASRDATIQALLKEKNKLSTKNADLTRENEMLQQALDQAKAGLEAETLARVDLENANQSLKEELAFKQQLHQQEIDELKERIHTINTMTVTLETDFQRQYDDRLGCALLEMKDNFEREASQYRDDVENTYKDQICNLKRQLDEDNTSVTTHIRENRVLREDVRGLKAKIKDLESQNASLADQVDQLEDQLKKEAAQHADQVDRLRQLLRDTRDELTAKIMEYEKLMDLKLSLDFEIMTYKKLLEDEEERLHLTPKPKPKETESDSTPALPPHFGAKRKKMDGPAGETVATNANSDCGIQIAVADASGRFVKVVNTSDQDQKLLGWKIQRTVGDQTLIYRFPNRSVLKAQSTVTVWTGRQQSKPPTDLIFKGKDSWGVGPESETELLNAEGEVVSKVETTANGEQPDGGSDGGTVTTTTNTRKILKPTRKSETDKPGVCVIS
eukprot:m.306763 g.306763  ORF g.306763 m.306763 type:complete len:564 (+) comp41567_c0_seq1:90-1781(+)